MITSSNGETMALNINIQIENSDALKALAYNSDTEILFVTYKSGGTYSYDDVSVNNMLSLIGRATQLNSWGKAHAEWKKSWQELKQADHTQNLANEVMALVDGLHPNDRKRLPDVLDVVLAVYV